MRCGRVWIIIDREAWTRFGPRTFPFSLSIPSDLTPDDNPKQAKASMGGNRKERRAFAAGQTNSKTSGAKSTGSAFQPSTEIDEDGIDYILQHPDYSGPKGKTLFEMADERQRELNKGKPGREPARSDQEEAIGPFGDALLYSLTMAVLHLTLDVLVFSQYQEDIVWPEIIKRAVSALPIFFFLVYLTHVEFSNRFPLLRNLVFTIGGIAAGCYLVFSGNKHGYFYVMKAAPPVGTLWVWSVVEMDVQYAALNAAVVFGYSKWNGFNFY
jgi:hypothetical protein